MMPVRMLRLIGVMLSSLILMASPLSADAGDAGDARAELISSWQKMTARKDLSFRATSTTTTKKGKATDMTMTVQWPDRFHMKNDQTEMIIVPGGTWMNSDGQWMKLPIDMQKAIAQYTPEMMRASMDSLQNVRFVGLDSVKGVPVKVYTYDFDTAVMGIKSTGSSKIFLSVASGYPLRMETQGKAMRVESSTIVEYEYDDSIRISAPN